MYNILADTMMVATRTNCRSMRDVSLKNKRLPFLKRFWRGKQKCIDLNNL